MRRRVSLYIADRMVDLDDKSLILFNYTMEDLTNPTIVKNAFSHQVTIKGTPNNNQLFGDIFRLDREVTYNGGFLGTDFNPSRKTPFVIYNELNEVLESGYCKLDSVTKTKGVVEYKVSLFGGLGSFIYSLAYDSEGNKRTLADLDYLGTGNTETELNFTINATNVKAAWDALEDEGGVNSKWKVINFAPAYNGIPDGNFSANKALVVPSDVGLQDTIDGYTLKNGYAMVNLSQAHDEWAVKDFRSYLQRPVFSMRAFLEAIKNPSNNGGYVVNTPFMDKDSFSAYKKTWMTLPLIPSIGATQHVDEDMSITLIPSRTPYHVVGTYRIIGNVPFGTDVSTDVAFRLQYEVVGATESTLSRYAYKKIEPSPITLYKQSVIFVQLVAYGSDGTIVGGSKVKTIGTLRGNAPSAMAERCGYIPPFENGDDTFDARVIEEQNFTKVGSVYRLDKEIGLSVEAKDVSYYEVHVSSYVVSESAVPGGSPVITSVSGGGFSSCVFFRSYDNLISSLNTVIVGTNSSITYDSGESLRSGAVISKAMLLSTSETPADYLLSFCKIFGLHILFDKASREITIMDRSDLYKDETIDLTERVDLSQGVDITPYVFDSKWYDFNLESAGGAFVDEYQSAHGVDYGIQRVNTGYDFNAETKNLLEGNVFKSAATILDRSKYYTMLKSGLDLIPSVFSDQGNTYTLWKSNGESLDTDIPVPSNSVTIEYYNEYGHPGYDIELARKMEFRDKDNKPIDGAGVLVFLEGTNTYSYFRLTDDVPAMGVLNDGKPCWILTPGVESGVSVPIFQRYLYSTDWTIDQSLDFGVPTEVEIPQITYKEDATIYARFWQNYLRDRFDVNTKVMTCKVNFSGLQVGTDLLRKFFWFDNAIWVLNSIKNYSLTTYDPVECEFVQVMDKDNYLNGIM